MDAFRTTLCDCKYFGDIISCDYIYLTDNNDVPFASFIRG